MKRFVRWTDSAIDDLKLQRIHFGEWKIIRAEVERIAFFEHLSLDCAVMAIRQCDSRWWRIKISRPKQIRVIFSIEQNNTELVVQAVFRRTQNTYNICQILYEVQQKKETRHAERA